MCIKLTFIMREEATRCAATVCFPIEFQTTSIVMSNRMGISAFIPSRGVWRVLLPPRGEITGVPAQFIRVCRRKRMQAEFGAAVQTHGDGILIVLCFVGQI